MTAPYTELAVTSNFSFLRGGSHAHELVETAAALGLAGIAIADRNTMAGIVRAHAAAKDYGVRLVVGVRLVLMDGFEVLCFPEDRAAYSRLTKLLTLGNRRAPKGECHLWFEDLTALVSGHRFIAMPPYQLTGAFEDTLKRLGALFPKTVSLSLSPTFRSNDRARFEALDVLARTCNAPLIATNDVLYHAPARRPLQDVLTCIREHCPIDEAGFRLERNAERHLKAPEEMSRLLAGFEDALARTMEIADACQFSLDELSYEYPDEPSGNSATPQAELERLTWEGAAARFPAGLTDKLRHMIEHELSLIAEMNFAAYFLTVHDIVCFARAQDPPILCQGRGSAANSITCYCLGITSVNPNEIDLLFERFISAARGEPPDIDVDFEHERREEVIQYIYNKYGRHRAGLAATVIRYRTRSALREVGKAMGLSLDVIGAMAGLVWGQSSSTPAETQIGEAGLDLEDPRLRQALTLTRQLIGFPRHLSQHVGGFVITRGALDEVVPIINAAMEDRTNVEWDKDDLDALGILKIDVLALGMLTCIRKAFALLEDHYDEPMSLAAVPRDDEPTYEMIRAADTVGVFQIESRAQMSMLPRLRPANFYDIVIEIAIVRPGPIQGDMVHPYLRRRQGLEPVEYLSPELEGVLKKTLGVPLFQEQAMKIAIVGAGFTPSESDQLRRAMATFRRTGDIGQFRDKFINGMLGNGYEMDFAERCFKQIEGFSDYGFPESHSASFALLAYASAWLKCHYPDVFACALLNSQPMGFYSSSCIVRDFRDHEGEVRPVDINHSHWDHTLEPGPNPRCHALRLGFRQVQSLREDEALRIMAHRGSGYDSLHALHSRTGLETGSLRHLAHADAFRSIGRDRRAALWEIQGLSGALGKGRTQETLPLFVQRDTDPLALLKDEAHVNLPTLLPGEHVTQDYEALRLSLKAHPVSFLRAALDARQIVPNANLEAQKADRMVNVAGLVLVRQRPGTASGVIFMTIEDETGIANVIVWPKLFEAQRRIVIGARMIRVRGMLQKEQGVIHVIARQVEDLTPALMNAMASEPIPPETIKNQTGGRRHPRDVQVLPKGRNFH